MVSEREVFLCGNFRLPPSLSPFLFLPFTHTPSQFTQTHLASSPRLLPAAAAPRRRAEEEEEEEVGT